METFYLRPSALKHKSDVRPERLAEWTKAFPKVAPAVVRAAAGLFPATSAKTFARWLEMRSAIGEDVERKEPVLQDEPGRFTIFPLRDTKMWEFRRIIQKLHWVAQEVDLSRDAADRKRVSESEFALLKKILGWFGPADESVMAGLDEVAAEKLRRKEGQFYLRAQSEQECVHSESYSLQIREVVPLDEQPELFAAAEKDPLVARVADWIRWWVVADHPAADFFAAMAFIEGVLFSGFFATLQHFKTKGVFPGITTLNEFISRDEGIHTLFWIFLLTERLQRPPDKAVVAMIARETVQLNRLFFEQALPKPVAGLNAQLLGQYVSYVADTVLAQLGCPLLYKAANPFDFMDAMSLNEVAKTNFFEYRSTQYQGLDSGDALEFAINTAPVEPP